MSEKLFYDIISPIKLTEAGSINIHDKGWGIISEYYLESVKINRRKNGISSAATLRIGDISGQATCVVKGHFVRFLFGLSAQEWTELENLCVDGQQLFYRYFKNGMSSSFSYEQKLFYNFCATNQIESVLIAMFIRCVNTRQNYKEEPLLEIIELRKCDMHLLDLYNIYLRQSK